VQILFPCQHLRKEIQSQWKTKQLTRILRSTNWLINPTNPAEWLTDPRAKILGGTVPCNTLGGECLYPPTISRNNYHKFLQCIQCSYFLGLNKFFSTSPSKIHDLFVLLNPTLQSPPMDWLTDWLISTDQLFYWPVNCTDWSLIEAKFQAIEY